MRWFLVATFILIVSPLWSNSTRQAEGYFNTNIQDDGRYLVEFKGKKIDVSTFFPANPKFTNQTAHHVIQDPLIQLFLVISKHQNVSSEHVMRMVLADIAYVYRGLNLKIVNTRSSNREEDQKDKITHTYQQFVLDLNNGFREFVTVNLYQNSDYDVMTITRFTLSPMEKENLEHRMKGNKITKMFHDETQLKIH